MTVKRRDAAGAVSRAAMLESVREHSWWICDQDLKYIGVRIDTRTNAWVLTCGDNHERIDPQRVIDAIDEFKLKYMSAVNPTN